MNYKQTPLIHAIWLTDYVLMQRLLEGGADPNERNSDNQTPLFYAVNVDVDMVRILIDAGADIHAADTNGTTVLMWSVGGMDRTSSVVQLLLNQGADATASDKYGKTLLHYAVDVDGYESNMPECVRQILTLLIEAGADIESRDRNGWTPLVLSVMMGTADEVRILLDLGADRSVTDFKTFNFCPGATNLLEAADTEPEKVRLLRDSEC